MAIINHYQGIVAFSKSCDFVEFGDVAVHAECAVSGDQTSSAVLCFLKNLLKGLHVAIGITMPLRFTKTDAIDDGRMIQRI